MSISARLSVVATRRSNVRCAICHDDVVADLSECKGCGSLYHRECRAQLAKCATLGCGSTVGIVRAAPAATAPTTRPGFWRRQFARERTAAQTTFDIIFGIVMPVVCLYYDPIVFRSAFGPSPHHAFSEETGAAWKVFGHHLFSSQSDFVNASYAFMGIEMLFLACFLAVHRVHAPIFGIVLALGAIFATGLGVMLAPLSFVALVVVVGALGFTPLITGFVFLRNAVRAFRGPAPRVVVR